MDESHWISRAQAAEAQLKTLKAAQEPVLERIRNFKANFGLRERSDGAIVINYEHFVQALGAAAALELRAEIDKHYGITGEPGKKPRMRVQA